MYKDLSISIILPAYNEEENIEQTVSNCVEHIEDKFKNYEIIAVNDGSLDATARIVNRLSETNPRMKLVNHEVNLGYGSALRSGFEAASMDYIFLMDSDGQFDISDIERLLQWIGRYDVVIGFRENRADPFIRSVNARLFMTFLRLLFGLKFNDIDCAFKLFPRRVYDDIRPILSSGALFSSEMLAKFKRSGFTIKEVPVRHFSRKLGSQTGASVKVILRAFLECWKYRKELRR